MSYSRKQEFSRGPKYSSAFIKELNRKVLFKDKIFLIDLTLRDSKKTTGGGHVLRNFVEGDDTHNLIPDMTIILNNHDLKVRFMAMIYKQVASGGIACLILRKLLTSSNLTWRELREFTRGMCEKFNSVMNLDATQFQELNKDTFSVDKGSCFKVNYHMLKNILNLIPYGFEPSNILDIGGTDKTKTLLASHFSKANITAFKIDDTDDLTELKEHNDNYDLVVCSHYLHHVNDKKEIADRITKLIKPGGYLFIRDADVESDDDQLLLDILHDFYDYVIMDCGVYKKVKLNYLTKDLAMELFDHLSFQSETHTKYDITNPIKAFNLLFQKPESKKATLRT